MPQMTAHPKAMGMASTLFIQKTMTARPTKLAAMSFRTLILSESCPKMIVPTIPLAAFRDITDAAVLADRPRSMRKEMRCRVTPVRTNHPIDMARVRR